MTTSYKPAILMLADGTYFEGHSVGVDGITSGEIVFNTGHTGYQEVLTDPSYAEQVIVFTFPHIGIVGVNQDDDESAAIWAKAMVVHSLSQLTSNYRAEASLATFLHKHHIIAISEIDTRALTKHIRTYGTMGCCIMAGEVNHAQALNHARNYQFPDQKQLINNVTAVEAYQWQQNTWQNSKNNNSSKNHIAVIDFGVKRNILRNLSDRDCQVSVLPSNTSLQTILSLKVDGIVLSNGPGNPVDDTNAIQMARKLISFGIPLLGICYGHQLIAKATGAKLMKLKSGHHGINHPVLNLENQKVTITSQNHNYAVDDKDLPKDLQVTHRSLFDQTIMGLRHNFKPILSFQGHPEACPGPTEIDDIFDQFLTMIIQVNTKYA